MEEISYGKFFEEIEKETISYYVDIEKNEKKDDTIKNIIKPKNLIDYFKYCSDTKIIIPILQKVNEYFLKNCEIHINNLKIYPIETEIYFVNDWFHDGMCHMNYLQKQHFGKLYFHKIKKDDKTINWQQGGVDVCISEGDYYLSILIRSALINGEMISGIKKFRDEIIPNYKEEINKIKKDSTIKEKKDEIKNITNRIDNNIDIKIYKRSDDTQIDIDIIYPQPRISGDKYAKCSKKFELNYLKLGNRKDNYVYLDKISKQNKFYKKYNSLKKLKEYKEEFNK